MSTVKYARVLQLHVTDLTISQGTRLTLEVIRDFATCALESMPLAGAEIEEEDHE